MIRDTIEFRKELEKINEWWITYRIKEAERYPLKRKAYQKIVLGMRRVGKTILAFSIPA